MMISGYKLVRSRRKTLALHITPQGGLEVRAPLRLSKAVIDSFVGQKEEWVAVHLAAARQRESARAAFSPQQLPFMGREYPLRRGEKACFDGEAFTLPRGEWGEVSGEAARLYRLLALPLLCERVRLYAAQMGVVPAAVKVNSAAARWGSCSGKNSLNFSWRLILAHPDAIDYVVVHELAHIREHNHSPAFWRVVAAVLPDYKRRQALLAALQKRLSAENWR